MKNFLFSNKAYLEIKCDFDDNESKWSKQEISTLLESAEQLKKNWKLVSKSFDLFCEKECKTKYYELKAQETEDPWTKEEDSRLLKLKSSFNLINWFEYSALFPKRSHLQYINRCSELFEKDKITGNWTYSELISILKYVKIFKFSWKNIIKYIPRRSQNSVKSFFHSTLRKIKKSSLFKFLKLMITWPTYTNKSKSLYFNL